MSGHSGGGGRQDDKTRAGEKQDESHPKKDTVEIERSEYEKLCVQAKELSETKDTLLRRAADFDNAKKRLRIEKEEFIKFANERLMRDLLPVIDNLERALAHAGQTERENQHPIVEGVGLVRKQIVDYLSNHGLSKIESLGKKFDPSLHEAVSHRESADYPPDTILEVVEDGYLLNGRLLRPAKVIISGGAASRVDIKKEEEHPKEHGHGDEA